MPVSELPFLVEQRVRVVEILDLPFLASGHNLNLTSEDMADLRLQGIAFDNNNNHAAENIPAPVKNTLPQLEEYNICRLEGIICLRRSINLHNTNADFKNYSCEEEIKMTKLELFIILFPVEYLKEIFIPEMNNLLKHPMYPGEFIRWLGCWLYMGFWVRILNRRNWWSTVESKIMELRLSYLISICQGPGLK